MAAAIGMNKTVAYKKQVSQGTAASGSGGQLVRRKSSVFKKERKSTNITEITSHQMSTGLAFTSNSTMGDIDGNLSPGTYTDLMASVLRRDFTAVTNITGLNVTFAATSPQVTATGATLMTAGLKIGMVVRFTTTVTANATKNFFITGITQTTLTGVFLNGDAVAAGTDASVTIATPGKYTYAPLTGHTNDWYTVEDYYADITQSELFKDLKPGNFDISFPTENSATIKCSLVGLGSRTVGTSQILTTPTAEVASDALSSLFGYVSIDGIASECIQDLSLTVTHNVAAQAPCLFSQLAAGTDIGQLDVTGQFTARFSAGALRDKVDLGAPVNIIFCAAEDNTATADFISFSIPSAKLTGDTPSGDEKTIVRTYPFTAQINNSGGAALSHLKTILAIQDSMI